MAATPTPISLVGSAVFEERLSITTVSVLLVNTRRT
jgi:hypothetical protein